MSFPLTFVVKDQKELDALKTSIELSRDIENDRCCINEFAERAGEHNPNHPVGAIITVDRKGLDNQIDLVLTLERLKERLSSL
jgi:hypothetical protein